MVLPEKPRVTGPSRRRGVLRVAAIVVAGLAVVGLVIWLVAPRLASAFGVMGNWSDYRNDCSIIVTNDAAEPVSGVTATFTGDASPAPWSIGDLAPQQSSEHSGKPTGTMVLSWQWAGQSCSEKFHTKLWGDRVAISIRGTSAALEPAASPAVNK
jgi:hypothetical protein